MSYSVEPKDRRTEPLLPGAAACWSRLRPALAFWRIISQNTHVSSLTSDRPYVVIQGASTVSTTTPAQSLQSPAPLASPAVYRFTVDEFERIADSLDNDQVELIDGWGNHAVARAIKSK